MAEMIDLVAGIGASIPVAKRQAGRVDQPKTELPYRGEGKGAERLRQRKRRELAQQHAVEVEQVQQVKQQREMHQKKVQWIVILVLVVLGLLAHSFFR